MFIFNLLGTNGWFWTRLGQVIRWGWESLYGSSQIGHRVLEFSPFLKCSARSNILLLAKNMNFQPYLCVYSLWDIFASLTFHNLYDTLCFLIPFLHLSMLMLNFQSFCQLVFWIEPESILLSGLLLAWFQCGDPVSFVGVLQLWFVEFVYQRILIFIEYVMVEHQPPTHDQISHWLTPSLQVEHALWSRNWSFQKLS